MLKVDPYDREKLIDPLFRFSWRYGIVVITLALIVLWGVMLYVQQYQQGLAVTGMNRPVYWGLYMVNFVFFIGISLAGTFTSAILRLTGVEWRRSITRLAEAVTVFALIIATIQIVIDMGRPERLLYIARYGRLQSPILWDVMIVVTYLLSSLTYLYLPVIPDAALIRDNMPENAATWQKILYRTLAFGWRGNVEQWRRLEKIVAFMAVIIIPVAVSVHTITSWLLATTVQPGWHSTVFGPYFVVTAIFSGISAIFVVMTVVNRLQNLHSYITLKQYRGLAWLFITMAIIWGYFTYTETLTLIAGQQLHEFPVLASKLWGQDAFTFWVMLGLIGLAFCIVFAALLTPISLRRYFMLQPPVAFFAILIALFLGFFLTDPNYADLGSSGGWINQRSIGWGIFILCILISILSACAWFRGNLVSATVIAGMMVLAGTWIERWNIIVPTLTHPRMIEYSSYTPSFTEVGITIASVALFILMFLVFFKLLPPVSIWEIAEGRLVEAAHEHVSIPVPESSDLAQKKRRWVFR